MAKFYFTYGTEGQPFCGGWTEVEAPDITLACRAFRACHPDKTKGLLNCSSVYDEEQFNKTEMCGSGGNFGFFCHETISLQQKAVCNLNFVGRDSWNRPVYQEHNGTLWKDVDPRKATPPALCTAVNNNFDGEPLDPMYIMKRFDGVEIRLFPRRDTWEDPIQTKELEEGNND